MMEPLTLKPRQPVESPEVENWDDDDFDNLDDTHFRAASTATSIASHPQGNHRDSSASSRLSIRSESNQGDENWDVLVDESATVKDAIAIAKSKGIPIPSNVPRSALEGGTIRRLRGNQIQKAIADDWSEDLDLPGFTGQLKLAKPESKDFPETLRQISAAFLKSPTKSPEVDGLFDQTIRSPKSRSTPISLDAFRDNDDDDFLGDVPTIKVAKQRSPQKPMLFQPPRPKAKPEFEDIEEGLELPSNGQLKLSTRKPIPRTPQQSDDLDLEWAEGSLGTRNGGRRDGRSNRSSSASALSPSVSSAFTAESEDEGLDGLILPTGPIQNKFEEVLKRRKDNQSPDQSDYSGERHAAKRAAAKEDFFAGIEIGDGDVFDSGKLTLNRNIKHKTQRASSPSKRATTTLNFTTTKSQSTISRLPRFQPAHDRHERARSGLEPVSETGAPVSRYKRPDSRLGGHSAHSSVSSIPAPLTPSQPSTPSRRGLRSAESRTDLRHQAPTTTSAQLLKSKRSMPVIGGLSSPSKATTYGRAPSRQDGSAITSRLNLPGRPRTPTDRAESRLGDARRGGAAPFLPAGPSTSQSQHISIKGTTSRHFRRTDSDGSNEGGIVAQKSISRLSGRPETPGRRGSLTSAELAAAVKKTLTKPTRRRNFGDGTELEIFDDLPTSATVESKFVKIPIGRGAPKSLRSKLGQSHLGPSTSSIASSRPGTETPMPVTPLTPIKQDFRINPSANIPRFARETASSRNAREQRQVSVTHHNPPPAAFQNMRGEPLQPLSTNWKAHVPARAPLQSPTLRKKPSKKTQQKPHLIKPMGNDVNRPKSEKGMQYNPLLFRWEGNENALAPFDVPEFHPRGQSPGGSPNSKPPALITNMNVGTAGGVQVVGGMVFDPRRMCWLKMAGPEAQAAAGLRGGSGVGSVQLEEEEDVFAGLEDLKEEDESRSISVRSSHHFDASPAMRNVSGESAANGEGANSGDEFALGEEFDVGPEFVRRQRSEEEKWKRKVEKWLRAKDDWVNNRTDDGRGGWRWTIRDVVLAAEH